MQEDALALAEKWPGLQGEQLAEPEATNKAEVIRGMHREQEVAVVRGRAHTCATSNRARRAKAAGRGAAVVTVLINSTGKAL